MNTMMCLQFETVLVLICDMIQGNELDVGYIVFEILIKKTVQIPLFYIVLSMVKSFITL